MALLEFKTYPDKVLAGKAASVDSFGDETAGLLDDLVETMYSHNGIWLAAPQVGKSLRIIVVDCTRAERRKPLEDYFHGFA